MQLTIRIAELPRYGGALILFRAVLSRRAQVALSADQSSAIVAAPSADKRFQYNSRSAT
jgi:hypothetical protein